LGFRFSLKDDLTRIFLQFDILVRDHFLKENRLRKDQSMNDPLLEIFLQDLSFFGGHEINLRFHQQSLGREVFINRGMKEMRYAFYPSDSFFQTIEQLANQYNFYSLPESPARPGNPDEAHPKITLKFASGRIKSVWKWINDKNEAFDVIYQALLQYLQKIKKEHPPIYKGAFDVNFTL
jgi:hypothetical protein